MKKILLLFITVLFSCAPLQRPSTFDPYGPLIWEGTINLPVLHQIPMKDILLVRPGTHVNFSGSYNVLQLDGACEMRGTRQAPIVFSAPAGSTNNIVVAGMNSSNVMQYCDFSASIIKLYKKCLISNCKIQRMELDGNHSSVVKNSLIGYLDCLNANTSEVSYSIFNLMPFSGINIGNPFLNVEIKDVSVLNVNSCDILGNTGLAGPLTNKVVMEYTSANLDLRNNYWRTNDSSWVLSYLIFNNLVGSDNIVPVSASPVQSAGPGW